MSIDNEIKPESKNNVEDGHDFEEAIGATRYGKFNVILILMVLPACFATISETTTMSYVFPVAQCDLDLDLSHKGLLNAVTYAGTISSSFMWGFLYDTFGRKKLMVYGFLLDGFFVLMSGLSQNLAFLMVMKFAGGFIISGPFGGLNAYLSEIHGAKHRKLMPLLMGLFSSIGTIYLALLAAIIFPLKIHWKITENFVLHSWNLYLIVSALPALFSGIFLIFFPESPKFLLSKGKHDKALGVFQKIYSFNTGKSKKTYPINQLMVSGDGKKKKEKVGKIQALKRGCVQMSPLFRRPLFGNFILVCTMQLCAICSLNTLRLWLPQLFQAIADYKQLNNGTSTKLCVMLDVIRPVPKNFTSEECFVNPNNFEVYFNSMISAAATCISYLVAGSLVNAIGHKLLLSVTSFCGGVTAASLYFAPNAEIANVLLGVFSSFGSIATTVILGIVVELFPTSLRTMAVSITMMTGRSAAMLGNVVFPILLETGCGPPFTMIALFFFVCTFLTWFVPNKSKPVIVMQ